MNPSLPQTIDPAQGRDHWKRGTIAARTQQWAVAREAFAMAVEASPEDLLYRVNLANALRHTRHFEESIAQLHEVLAADPAHELALQLLADCQLRAHDFEATQATCNQLLALGHQSPQALITHANALQSMDEHGPAVEKLILAFGADPKNAQVHSLLSRSFRRLGFQKESVECIKWAREQETEDSIATLSFLSFEKRHVFDWSGFDEDLRRITRALENASGSAVVPTCSFGLLSLPVEPALLKRALICEASAACAGVEPIERKHTQRRAGQKVRLGFVSHDFKTHPVAQLTVDLFERLDRDRFEVLLYSTGASDGSGLRQRIESAGDRFIDVSRVSDREAALTIHGDGVDVLFDLGGYTTGCRPAIFAFKPAPVQVNFLGFPGTSGAPHMDFIVGDPYVTPADCADLYTESIAQMPTCFQPNGRWRPLPQSLTRQQAGLPADAFVMCAFNHSYKIHPQCFDVWCDLLKRIPHGVLWLKEINAQLHENVWKEAQARGIASDRIVFARSVPYEFHFSRLAQADVFTDTWPYNAHTTASDAIWAGVPVVTLYQNSYASRVAASVLNAAGIPELALTSIEDYKCTILALARDPKLLQNYKDHLSQNRMSLPLFDTDRYVRDFGELAIRMLDSIEEIKSNRHLLA